MELLWLFGVGGLLVTGIGLWLTLKTWHLVRHGASATGRYVDATWQPTETGNKLTQYGLIEFETASGECVRFEGRLGTPFEGRKVGRTVPVRYLPSNPQGAVVASFVELWLPSIIFLTIGLGWLLFTLVAAVVRSG